MYTQFNARIHSVYASRWHFDAGYEAIATFMATLTAFDVTIKSSGESVSVATLGDVNAVIGDHVENMTRVELWKAGLRTRFH